MARAEQEEIASHLEELKLYARETLQLTAAQQEIIEGRLDYLTAAASRMGRIDWRNTFVGVMLTLAVEGLVPPDSVRTIVTFTLRGLGHLFGVEIPELPPG